MELGKEILEEQAARLRIEDLAQICHNSLAKARENYKDEKVPKDYDPLERGIKNFSFLTNIRQLAPIRVYLLRRSRDFLIVGDSNEGLVHSADGQLVRRSLNAYKAEVDPGLIISDWDKGNRRWINKLARMKKVDIIDLLDKVIEKPKRK